MSAAVDDSTPASRRRPTTGFPIVPLPEATKIIREAGKYGFEHSVSSFARYMGHTTTNSGAFRRRLAAFRDWKLIAGRGDTIVFTDTAKRLALPPDQGAERDALQLAFMNCGVFVRLYESVQKSQPVQREKLGAKAVHELGISPSAVDRFTSSFVDSAVAAGLAQEDNGQVILLEPPGVDSIGHADEQPSEHAVSVAASTRTHASLAEVPAVIHQEYSVPGGQVLFEIRVDRPLSAPVFGHISAVVEAAEALVDRMRELGVDRTG